MKIRKPSVESIEKDPWLQDWSRHQNLSDNPAIQEIDNHVSWWFNSDEGWDNFNTAFIGASNDVAKFQADISSRHYAERHREIVTDEKQLNLIEDGLWRAISSGWAIAVAPFVLEGWLPSGSTLDKAILADMTANSMDEVLRKPPSDLEWFGYSNRSGITVYQWLLLPLGVSSDQSWSTPANAELMGLGQWLLRYGIGLGRAQVIIQNKLR